MTYNIWEKAMYITSFESCYIRYIMPHKLPNTFYTKTAVEYVPFTLAYQRYDV